MSTGFATLASAGRTARSAARVSSASSGSSSPAASQASAQRIPRPPAFVTTATRRPARQRLAREQRRGVDELLERPRRAARRPGGRARRPPPPDPASAAVCELAARCAGARSCPPSARGSACVRATRAREAAELARVAERLQVEEDELGLLVVLPPLEQVVRRDVGLVADRDERREAEPALGRLLEQREAERAALRREADAARRQRARREGRVQAERRRRRSRGSSGRRAARRARGRARAAAPAARALRARPRRSPRR